jgi:hypothetical protein
VYHWFTKNSDNMLKGLKLNLQSMMGSKLPNGLLSFVFKHTYVRKVNALTVELQIESTLVKVFRKFGRIVLPNPSKACINLDKK